jgi:tryptophanyl-tRNA synthetase
VGEDQVSHVELSREIVRRFNLLFRRAFKDFVYASADNPWPILERILGGPATRPKSTPYTSEDRLRIEKGIKQKILEDGYENFRSREPVLTDFLNDKAILNEPGVMLTKTPRIPGLDGRKMSKSYGNAITLSETDEEIRKKTKVMVTDPARKRRTDPGNPDVCPVYDWHKLFSAGEPGRLEWVRQGCTTAGIGCIECKAAMAENLIQWIGPKREARNKWEKDPKGVVEMIDAGSKKARVEARKTMERVREAVFGWEKKKAEVMK